MQESAIITCSVIAYPSLNVTWYRNGQEVGKGNDSSEIDVYQKVVNLRPDYFLQPVASILYVNPNNTKSQFGNYTCRAAPNVSKRVEIVRKYQLKSIFWAEDTFITQYAT